MCVPVWRIAALREGRVRCAAGFCVDWPGGGFAWSFSVGPASCSTSFLSVFGVFFHLSSVLVSSVFLLILYQQFLFSFSEFLNICFYT